MTGQLLSQVLDAMLQALIEAGREAINIYLGRHEMEVFQRELVGKHPEAVQRSTTSGLWRNTQVNLWHWEASAIVISPRT